MRPLPRERCLALVHAFEGRNGTFEPTRTADPAGNQEIGWSHRLSGITDPLWFATLDKDGADALALTDLAGAGSGVCAALGDVVDKLSDGQYAALVDFAYNVGVGAFRGSTLCHLITVGAMHLAEAEFGKWVYAKVDGVEIVLPGLVERRAAEAKMWNSQ